MGSVAVIGGGAAGLLCAGLASEAGAAVTLFEKNKSERKLSSENFYDNAYLGKKLLITGKGRCNVTNNCDKEELFANVPQNARFMYSAFSAFSPVILPIRDIFPVATVPITEFAKSPL